MLSWVVDGGRDKGVDVGLCLECNSCHEISSQVRTNILCEGISRNVIKIVQELRGLKRK
ncbi:hypothetical protein HZA98_04350 [Candidatus Woesearchaeota archaeon]|nr:hypothetical protein [Candidatus Woesearchaeota archaeon]